MVVHYKIIKIHLRVSHIETIHTSANIRLKSQPKLFLTEVTMEVIAAQAFVFFLAGFETSSTTMTFCLYELAMNPDIQERVRNEIDTVLERHGGNITYESIVEMEYLDKVVSGKSSKLTDLTHSLPCVKKKTTHGTFGCITVALATESGTVTDITTHIK